MKKPPLLYYRSAAQIKSYRSVPAREKMKWLEETMRFFYLAKLNLNRRIRSHSKAHLQK